jgi:hypothetical protein
VTYDRGVTEPIWVVLRDGSAHEALTPDGTWGPMSEARVFDSADAASEATVPVGTRGTPREQHPDAQP